MNAPHPKPVVRNPKSRGAGAGLAVTIEALARSSQPKARELLFAAIEAGDAATQAAAAQAVMRYAREDGLPRLIERFHRLAPEVAGALVRSIDEFTHALSQTLAGGPAAARANAVEMVRRAARVELAYLLVQAVSDADSGVSARALEGLARLADGVRRELRAARAGDSDVPRAELETRALALLDPLLEHLRDLSRPQPDALLLLVMGLDPRASDLLFGILTSRQDPRAERLERLLLNAASPEVVSFLFDMLRDSRLSARAAAIFRARRDLPFVRALLATDRFFADSRVRESLRGLAPTDLLRSAWPDSPGRPGGEPRSDVFSDALLALRAVHLVALSGAAADDKLAFFDAVAAGKFPPFVTGLAECVASALRAGRRPDEISAALVYLEGGMGMHAAKARPAEAREIETGIVPELELPWAHPATSAAGGLPADAFTQFFNAFDRLDEATKRLAAESLKRVDPAQIEKLREELEALDPERRLRAVKIVAALRREHDLEGALLTLASDPDRHVRATVVKMLGLLEDDLAVRALLEAVTDGDRRVIANSVEAIERLGRAELSGLVRVFTSHPNNRIRANAIKALWSLGERGSDVLALLDRMLEEGDEMRRLSATWLLGEIDHPRRIEKLQHIAKSDASARVRAKARAILGEAP